VLAAKKVKVLEAQAKFKGKLENLEPQLRAASGFAFYNTSRYDLEKLLADAPHLASNLRNYIAGFSPNMRVADDGTIVGVEKDQLETDDKFMRHHAQVVRNGLGDRAGTCIDPKTQIVQERTVCVVSCQRSPEPVFLKWKGIETTPEGDFFVRSGPGTVKLPPHSSRENIRTRFPAFARHGGADVPPSSVV
jgi:hypothetical protein